MARTLFDPAWNIQAVCLLLCMLLLQYSTVVEISFPTLERYRSIPASVLFIGLLLVMIFRPFRWWYADQTSVHSILRFSTLVVFILWLAATAYAYTMGSTVRLFSWSEFALICLGLVGTYAIGYRTRRREWFALGVSLFLILTFVNEIRLHPFDDVFGPGRPIWNIEHAAERLRHGIWVYQLDYGVSLAYLPFLVLPYLPFGMIGLDLRWVNLGGMLVLVWLFLWERNALGQEYDKKRWNRTPILVAVAFLSPVLIYHAMTTQVIFYWVYLVLFVRAILRGNIAGQRTGLWLATLSRQLSWPLWIPWLLWNDAKNHLSFHRSFFVADARRNTASGYQSSDTGLFQRLRYSFGWLWPSRVELVLFVTTLLAVLIAPIDFLWSVFSLAAADAQRALSAGILQTSCGLSLNPLLPFAHIPTAVLVTQFVLVLLASLVLLRSGVLSSYPAHSMVVVYVVFLSFNLLLYDYYWIAPLLMSLVIVLDPRSNRPILE